MSASTLQLVAEAVKEALNVAAAANQFVSTFAAERVDSAVVPSLADLATLKVWVVGRKTERDLETRGGLSKVSYLIDVLVQKKLADPDDNDETDPLKLLCEEIGDWFKTHAITGRSEVFQASDTSIFGAFDQATEHPTNLRAFCGGTTITFLGFET